MIQTDKWREAILVERKRNTVHKPMLRALGYLLEQNGSALVLGDASLVQSKYLIETAKFLQVVDVDVSPTLLDDDFVSRDEKRIVRVVSSFDKYMFPQNTFDLVYGKSIAFNPKETTSSLLGKIHDSLKEGGIFSAVWGAKGDSFRPISYTEDELRSLYSENNFEILDFIHLPPTPNAGLTKPGTRHVFTIIARKR